jgi:hypothetical protein
MSDWEQWRHAIVGHQRVPLPIEGDQALGFAGAIGIDNQFSF